MRVVGARSVVDNLSRGMSPSDACRAMLDDAASLPDVFASDLRAVCLTPDGRHGAAALRPGASYAVMTAADASVKIVPAAV